MGTDWSWSLLDAAFFDALLDSAGLTEQYRAQMERRYSSPHPPSPITRIAYAVRSAAASIHQSPIIQGE